MWDLKEIQKAGGTADKLKAKFEAPVKDPKIKQFIDHSVSRIKDGVQRCQKEANLWWAIDKAFDVAQRQTTFTLAGSLANKDLTSNDAILSAVKEWNLENMLVDVCGPDGQPTMVNGSKVKKLDVALFTQIFCPLVASHTKARWAKLFGDRDVSPLYKYSPLTLTEQNRMRTELITSMSQRQATNMGYREAEKQSILQMLLYGTCINFPMEDWYTERQMIDGKEAVQKEGLRFTIPHPSRMFWDIGSPLASLNTDTGVQFKGYYDVYKYRDIRHDTAYWNREQVTKGDSGSMWRSSLWSLYSQLYPCNMRFPEPSSAGDGAGDKDRLSRAFYGTDEDDSAVVLTVLFQKVIPKDWGLFDYAYPVWIRTVFAGDDTVVHCIPFAYTPGCAYLYDADSNRAFSTSLALEILPWQDLIGNYLTEHLCAVKQNLMKVIFYNTDQLTPQQIDQIKNLGDKLYRAPTFIPHSKEQNAWSGQTPKQAFDSVAFPQQNTNEIAGAIEIMIKVMERMLGFSPQELGASASHEQSATEVHITNQNTSVRLQFTGSFVDAGMNARKRMIYDATMAHGSDEVFAEVADLNDIKRESLKELGFEIEEKNPQPGIRSTGVKGKKSALRLDGFASETEGQNRIADAKIASTMIQTFQSIFSNPAIIEAIGFDQLINLFNQILGYTGLPKEFRLKLDETLKKQMADSKAQQGQQQGAEQQSVVAGLQEQMAQIAQAAVAQGQEQMADEIQKRVFQPLSAGQQQTQQAIMAILKKMQEQGQKDGMQDQALAELIMMLQPPSPPPPPPGVIPMPIPGSQPLPPQYAQMPPGIPPI